MTEKPEYIKNLEGNGEVMSSIQINFPKNGVDEFLDKRNLDIVWSKGWASHSVGKIEINEKIYKTKQGFYLYLLINKDDSTLMIYYNQPQYSELTIFITQLLKQFKNDTTTNK